MRKLLIPCLVLAAAAALAIAASATGARSASTAPTAIPGCGVDSLNTGRRRHAHDRRGQPGLPAVVRRRREDEAVEGLRPVQRQGLRVRRRVRRREGARLHEGAGQVDGRAVRQLVPPGQEVVRLLPHPGLVHPRARSGGRLLDVVLLRQPGRRRAQVDADREGEVDLRAQALQARSAGRDDELHVHHALHQAELGSARVRHERRRRAGAEERSARRDRRRPAHRLLRTAGPAGQRQDRRKASDEGHEGALRDGVPEREHVAALRRQGDRAAQGNGTLKKLQTTYLARAGAPDIR